MTNFPANSENWDLVIRPRGPFFQLNLKEVWKYRDLLFLFVKRDFIAQYKQTILGPLWHIFQPVITTAIFLLIFNRVARIPTDGVNPILFYMTGITFWNYFAACFTGTSNTFIANASIFGKVYFPRLVIPLAVVISNLIRLGIQLGLVLVAILWFYLVRREPLPLTVNVVYLVPAIVAIAITALGLGIVVSSLTTKYRDMQVFISFSMQLFMYATPVVYSLSYISSLKVAWLIKLNPLVTWAELFRFSILGNGMISTSLLMYSIVFAVVSLLLGIMMFNKVEKSFMDTV